MPPRQASPQQAKALLEDGLKALRWEWYRRRVEEVLQKVSAFDILRRNGIRIKQVSETRAEQIHCPFHGADNKPSARVYPDNARRASHIWCYVCQKSWDAIGLHMGFQSLKFSQALSDLERNYGIEVPEMPKDLEGLVEQPPDEALEQFYVLFEVSERRLKLARPSYKALQDLQGYLTASSVLDKVLHRVENRRISPDRGVEVLHQLLGKVSAKIQAGYAVLEGDCLAG